MFVAKLLCVCCLVFSDSPSSLRIDGRDVGLAPPPVVENGAVFVPLHAFSAAVHREAKVIADGAWVILCDKLSCVPVRVGDDDRRTRGGVLFVRLGPLADALSYESEVSGGDVLLRTRPGPSKKLAKGAMLPDVALTDLSGKTVRLTDFLGRRVLICTWASW